MRKSRKRKNGYLQSHFPVQMHYDFLTITFTETALLFVKYLQKWESCFKSEGFKNILSNN